MPTAELTREKEGVTEAFFTDPVRLARLRTVRSFTNVEPAIIREAYHHITRLPLSDDEAERLTNPSGVGELQIKTGRSEAFIAFLAHTINRLRVGR